MPLLPPAAPTQNNQSRPATLRPRLRPVPKPRRPRPRIRLHCHHREEEPMTDAETIARLEEQIAVARAKERSWRDAYHSLRLTIEDRLDRVTTALESWESTEDRKSVV